MGCWSFSILVVQLLLELREPALVFLLTRFDLGNVLRFVPPKGVLAGAEMES